MRESRVLGIAHVRIGRRFRSLRPAEAKDATFTVPPPASPRCFPVGRSPENPLDLGKIPRRRAPATPLFPPIILTRYRDPNSTANILAIFALLLSSTNVAIIDDDVTTENSYLPIRN
ncbi:hypothetical protein EUGRSUZ_H01347 [Eucalyptus grandis]|uniref:Uncharacterized protein n=2 Tax=Eucalyptus grandis TaxID=71139 RepID=A0ACC3JP98_EUCGR|nr:hypothetical protein EUGRSUZ_H01347 [Eucalyptus grandis]